MARWSPLWILMLIGMLMVSSQALAQSSDPILYAQEKKNPSLAAGMAVPLPTLGHLYGGDWKRGAKFVFVEGGAVFATLVGAFLLKESSLPFADSTAYILPILTTEERRSSFGKGVMWFGIGMFGAFKAWEIFDAIRTVHDYNAMLRKAYRIGWVLPGGEPGISLRFYWGNQATAN